MQLTSFSLIEVFVCGGGGGCEGGGEGWGGGRLF